MNSLKKAFSSFVSLATIVWSVGGTLAFPSVASAATLNSGDLIKASTAAVYYYAADGKRYVFPNEKTYFTWYSNFSSVKTITDAELAAISIGGNVTYRPGVKMVKITTDPKVYAVSMGGSLRHVPSEACAVTLYGANWNTMIEDVPDGFFVNYTVGSPIASDCSGYDKAAQMAGSPTINADLGATPGGSTTGAVSVSLASDTPAGITTPKNAASVSLFKANLTAGSAAATITGLKVRRLGVGATSDFSNVYLYDGNGNRLTTGRTINSSTNLVEFNGLSLSVPANSTISVVLVGDFSSPSTTGGQHAFEITDAASVTAGGSISGSFPVRGNTFTVGTQSAAELDVFKGTTPSNPTVGAQGVEISNFKFTANTNDIEVRRITLLQGGDINNTDLKNLKLYQGSTMVASTAALAGDKIVLNFNPPFVIEDGQTKVFSLKADISGRSSRTIRTYVEYTTDVYAIDKLYNSGAAIDIDDSSVGFDGTSYSSCSSAGLSICVTTQGGQLTVAFNGPPTGNLSKGSQDAVLYKFALTSAESALEIRKLRFRIDVTSAGNGLVQGTDGTDFFTDVKVRDADTGATLMGPASMSSSAVSGTYFLLTDTFNLAAGQTRNLEITADLSNSTDTAYVDESYRICLGNNTDVDGISVASVSTLCDSDEEIFESGDIKVIDTGENLDVTTKVVPNTAISGNSLTVKASSLTVAMASAPSAGTAVKKQTKVPSVGLVFTAGNQSDVMIRSVKVTGTGSQDLSTYTLALLNDIVNSCALYDGETQVGTAQTPDGTNGDMTFTNVDTNITAGSSKTLVVKCTVASVIDGAQDNFAIGVAANADITAEDNDSNTVTASVSSALVSNSATSGQGLIQSVKSAGTLTINAGSQPSSTLVVGGNWVKFAEFSASAQFEDVTLERMAVTSTGDAANFSSVAVRVAGVDKGTNILPSGLERGVDIDLTSSPITVAKDTSVTFELWGQLRNVQSSSSVSGATTGAARSGNSTSLALNATLATGEWDSNYSSSYNVKSLGAASGERIYATGSSASFGNAMILRKTKPTITKLAVSTNTISSGAPTDLYKFQVTPDAAGDVRWKQIVFTVTSSSGTTTSLNNFQFFRGGTQLTANTQVYIYDGQGNDITGSTNMVATSTSATVIVKMVTEEVVSGSGTTYTLRATPTATGSGNTISVQLARTATSVGSATGYLAGAAGGALMSIDTSAAPNGGDTNGYFLWSDVSEPAGHSYTTTTPSYDWTNDVYVEDMTQSQVFTKN